MKSALTPNSTTNKQFYVTTDSKLSGVYAEVRGKYARPPPLMQKSTQADILAPKDNIILSRPSTAGSLKPRSSTSQKPNPQSFKRTEESSASPIKRRIFKYRTASNHSKYEDDKKSVQVQEKTRERTENQGKKIEEDKQVEFIEKNDEEAEENLDQVDELREQNEEKWTEGSQVSGVTTSSQRRYILELESLLRKEKLKRIQIEESLKKALESSD